MRWITGFGNGGKSVPSAATFAAFFIYSLSGAINALLFLFTRADLLLLGSTGRPKTGLPIGSPVVMSANTSKHSVVSHLNVGHAQSPSVRKEASDVSQAQTNLLPLAGDGGWFPCVEENGSMH